MSLPLHVALARPDDAAELQPVTRAAFAEQADLTPPSGALRETPEDVAADLGQHGGVVVRLDGTLVAGLRFGRDDAGAVWLRRVAVDPAWQGHGIGSRMAIWTHAFLAARRVRRTGASGGEQTVHVGVREALPQNVRFWSGLGYRQAARHDHTGECGPLWLELTRPLPRAVPLPTTEDTRGFGARLGAVLRAGDLVMLSGDLGAGKTTLTQGVARGLDVRGDVTSPTFVIARVHRPRERGPALVHVDAYRLGGVAEVDHLDLDASLEESVTVVEWGEGLVERLSRDRLEVRLFRPVGAAPDDADDEARVAVVDGYGSRWADGLPV